MSTDSLPLLSHLKNVAVLSVAGGDATSFLQAQLSCDVRSIRKNSFGLAAWHSPAGKVKALFKIVSVDSGWLLTTNSEGVDEAVRNLTRFVLRDDVSIVPAASQVAALTGDAGSWLDTNGVGLGDTPGDRAQTTGLMWLRLGPEVIHVVGETEALEAIGTDLGKGDGTESAAAEIELGLPSLPAVLRDRFVPQMLNLDLLGALDADKGCYPGQEIITRTKNLGAVKRRMLRFSSSSKILPEPANAIVDGNGEAAGEIVRAARTNAGLELLGIVRLAALDGALYSSADTSKRLRREPLPYDSEISPSLPALDAETG